MIWKKFYIGDRKFTIISVFAVIFLIVSLYIQSKLVLFLAVFFLIVAIINHLYLNKAGDQLYYENINEKNRFFIDDHGQWIVTFRNEGFPILRAELRVYFDYFVAPTGEKMESSFSMYDISVPMSIYTKQTKQIIIPFSAKKRGIAKIRKLEFHVPSLFGFGETFLESTHFIKQQAVVYPKPIPVEGLTEQMSLLQGENVVPYSIFENRLGTVGTRDYIPSDSFNSIHWKASIRKQTLQTKVYETITEKGWNIALNVSDGYAITGELEKLISSLTEIAYFAFNRKIPYSLCINVSRAGTTPFLYLPVGEGKEHLSKVLETLASISTQNTSLLYENMLSFYQMHLVAQPFFIHAGIRTEEINRMLQYISNTGVKLFELKMEQGHGSFTKMEILTERRQGV